MIVISWKFCVKENSGNELSILPACVSPNKLTYNPAQNIWNKIEKSSKTGQGKKILIPTFPCSLTATAKV